MLTGDLLPWCMFGLGVAMLIAILFRRSSRYYSKLRRAREPTRRSDVRSQQKIEPLIDAPRETLQWQVEMHETARDLKGELDSKMIALQVLIGAAREQAQRLEDAIAAAKRIGGPDPIAEIEQLADGKSIQELQLPDSPPAELDVRLQDQIHRLAAAGHASQAIADQLGTTIGEVELLLSLRSES